jgi:hypothetical protein
MPTERHWATRVMHALNPARLTIVSSPSFHLVLAVIRKYTTYFILLEPELLVSEPQQ